MSASFYDLLKYAKTGIASPGMTAYDKMRAVAMAGGKVKTLTGVPPLIFKSNGKPLTAWSMLGNSQQNGTPAPDAPIMPDFCGDRTANLFNTTWQSGSLGATGGEFSDINAVRSTPIPCDAEKTYTFVPDIDGYDNIWVNYYGTTNTRERIDTSGGTFTTPQGCEQVRFRVTKTNIGVEPVQQYIAMLNIGSTPLPYEPYGYKLPITNAGQTVPIYLGQTQTMRKVKKLVLDGTEDWASSSGGTFYALSITPYMLDRNDLLSTHFFVGNYSGALAIGQIRGGGTPSSTILFNYDNGVIGVEGFKSWLASKYAAGTPVTIWYDLATPETGIVNEPLCKIGDYADELHSADAGVSIPTAKGANTLTVDTDLKPSSMTITYRG